MDENERCGQPHAREVLPNGLPRGETAFVMRPLESDSWYLAELRTSVLIDCIKPSKASEEFRGAVASYLQRIIKNCFPCQIFSYGSVPLKTYLPDGDIDITTFCNTESMNEDWVRLIRDALENEKKNENSEFRVKEVQYIQAEVKIIKCLVETIVVDISFNQLSGLATLCFLEEIDHLIGEDHLFKRSMILIKAWCFYESRVLGAYHGLISTYALETLVLYIFHIFNNSFSGPLEVLYRFLEFFSKFDWNIFCLSLWGPVPISCLPDVTAHPPRNDGGTLLLSKRFLETCSALYTVLPNSQEKQKQPFTPKFLNVVDPLCLNNNLGRSVSKGNFFRIINAFAYGASRLRRILDCPKGDIPFEVNQFFLNTWNRHGNGERSDMCMSHCEVKRNDPPLHSNKERSNKSAGEEDRRNKARDGGTTQASCSKSIVRNKGSPSSLPPKHEQGGGGPTKKKRAKKKKKGKAIASSGNESFKCGSEYSQADAFNKPSVPLSETRPRQRNADNVLYQIGPPLPFIALYNLSGNECSDSADTLDSDFASHWQNLQFGRLCQVSGPPSMISHPPGCCLHQLSCRTDSGNGGNELKCSGPDSQDGAGSSQFYAPFVFVYPCDQSDFALQSQLSGSPTHGSSPAVRR